MAKLFITEYEAQGRDAKGIALESMPNEPALVEQTPVVIGAGSLQSAAFNAATKYVRIHADAICSIKFGTNPTATANTMRMAANQTEMFAVRPGDKVAVITNT